MIAARQPIHVAGHPGIAEYRDRRPGSVAMVERAEHGPTCSAHAQGGTRVGGIAIYRPEVRPFTQKQIDLLSTFAAQAVIAIENVRLFNETKEALEQQTVISEILRVISSSPTDTQPVFDAIVKSGVHLFGGMNVIAPARQGRSHRDGGKHAADSRRRRRIPVPLDDDRMPAVPGHSAPGSRADPGHPGATDWVSERLKQRAEQQGLSRAS